MCGVIGAKPGDARIGRRGVADVKLIDRGLGLRDVNPGAEIAAQPPDQCGEGADGGDPPDDVVGEDRRRVVERMTARAGGDLAGRPQARHAGGGSHQGAVAHLGAPRTAVAERAAFGENQARVQLVQSVIRKAQCGKGSGFEIREQGIGGPHQTLEDGRAVPGPQLQPQTEMVAMRPHEGFADRLALTGLPQAVGVGGALQLDDLGTEVAEQPAQLAPGDDDPQIENPQALEGQAADRPTRVRIEPRSVPVRRAAAQCRRG